MFYGKLVHVAQNFGALQRSARQTIIARSTMESKLVAFEMVDNKAKWLKKFLANIPRGTKPTPSVSIHCDYQSTIAIAKNKNYNGKNKHIQLRHNLVKQLLNIMELFPLIM
ncbi:hypothetical protein V8G54_001458 [Vigna mungo]|uniref:Retrovirus-related Pol polyprotein from transposon TNT 1-94 n=1 Tax=Vigna mungo TaxID=3915 RepID=A0AAQ3S891_VIGMU